MDRNADYTMKLFVVDLHILNFAFLINVAVATDDKKPKGAQDPKHGGAPPGGPQQGEPKR